MADKQNNVVVKEYQSKTLFVQNLPYTATNEQLEELFSDIGPLKKCFVVKDKESGKCRGVGYVTFALQDDVSTARDGHWSLGGRKLRVDIASSKKSSQKRKPNEECNSVTTDSGSNVQPVVKATKRVAESKASSLPRAGPLKRGRLIVRNLSFKCEEDNLCKLFAKFGEVSEVKIPLFDNGKKKGFGIVQFVSAANAATAMKQLNGSSFLDRPIAVDWAVSKDRYLSSLQQTDTEGKDDSHVDKKVESQNNDNDKDDDDDNDDDDDDNTDDDDDDDDDDKDGSDVSDKHNSDDGLFDSDNHDSDEEDDEDEDDDDEDEDEDDGKKRKRKSSQNKIKPHSDVEQGLTVFVRNLSYNTDDDELKEAMSRFGQVVYSRVVVDPETEHPRGTAFVKFKTKEGVDKCLSSAQDDNGKDGGLIVDGRKLIVSLAVPRDKVKQMVEGKKLKDKSDGRNLHLIRESFIRPGTKEAEGLSKADVAKRMKVEAITRAKLKNPNTFVSTTRLCVRNIPATVDDRGLKQALLRVATNPRAKITECRIMRDLSRVGASGAGKSRGYAFVNFSEHLDALQVLKATNNAEIFGNKKRLIVEFSLENRSALQAKEKRAERIRLKQNMLKKSPSQPAKKSKPVPNISKPLITATGQPVPKYTAANILPSHSGPKIRHKKRHDRNDKRQKTQTQKKNSGQKVKSPTRQPVNKFTAANHTENETKGPKKRDRKKRSRQRPITDNVDKLVQKYRAKLSSKHSDWFDM